MDDRHVFLLRIKEEVKERLQEAVDTRQYLSDLGFYLTEHENNSCCWEGGVSTSDMAADLENFLDFSEWYEENFGEPMCFTRGSNGKSRSLQSAYVCMMVCAVDNCYGAALQILADEKGWDDDFMNTKQEITQEFVDGIISVLDKVESIW